MMKTMLSLLKTLEYNYKGYIHGYINYIPNINAELYTVLMFTIARLGTSISGLLMVSP